MSKKLEFTDSNFEAEVITSQLPVLVDFWAPWCGPCKILEPVVEEIAGLFEGKLKVGKMNTDDNRDTAAKYGIMSIPTIIIFKDGKVHERIVGAQPKKTIVEKINGAL